MVSSYAFLTLTLTLALRWPPIRVITLTLVGIEEVCSYAVIVILRVTVVILRVTVVILPGHDEKKQVSVRVRVRVTV